MQPAPAESLHPTELTPASVRRAAGSGLRLALALVALTKPRLALFSTFSALAGYLLAQAPLAAAPRMLAGTLMSACGALAFNQWWEWRLDARMRRTAARPIPSGQVSPRLGLGFSLALCALGLLWLHALAPLAAALALAIMVGYGLIYTPLKRRSLWATEVGAVPGALPVLLGAAAGHRLDSPPAWVLFALLLFWQMPHFYAIGWMYREDYRRAGYRLLPALDPDGRRTARRSLGYSLAIVPSCLASWYGGLCSAPLALAGVLMGLALAWGSRRLTHPERPQARPLFLASIVSLPLVLLVVLGEALGLGFLRG